VFDVVDQFYQIIGQLQLLIAFLISLIKVQSLLALRKFGLTLALLVVKI
jgi:hypothetical protein